MSRPGLVGRKIEQIYENLLAEAEYQPENLEELFLEMLETRPVFLSHTKKAIYLSKDFNSYRELIEIDFDRLYKRKPEVVDKWLESRNIECSITETFGYNLYEFNILCPVSPGSDKFEARIFKVFQTLLTETEAKETQEREENEYLKNLETGFLQMLKDAKITLLRENSSNPDLLACEQHVFHSRPEGFDFDRVYQQNRGFADQWLKNQAIQLSVSETENSRCYKFSIPC